MMDLCIFSFGIFFDLYRKFHIFVNTNLLEPSWGFLLSDWYSGARRYSKVYRTDWSESKLIPKQPPGSFLPTTIDLPFAAHNKFAGHRTLDDDEPNLLVWREVGPRSTLVQVARHLLSNSHIWAKVDMPRVIFTGGCSSDSNKHCWNLHVCMYVCMYVCSPVCVNLGISICLHVYVCPPTCNTCIR